VASRTRTLAPLGALLLSLLAAHAALVPHLAVWEVAPDLPLVGVAAVAVGRGPRAGAAFGFAAGLGADLFLATPVGTSALAYTVVGQLLGRCSRPRPAGTARTLCRPGSACFACRTGRAHGPAPAGQPGDRPARIRRQAAARRAAIGRSVLLTVAGVAGGRLATAAVATALGGMAAPGPLAVVRIAAVSAVSAPLAPPLFAAVRRLATRRDAGARR
jgi:hypothetical protein